MTAWQPLPLPDGVEGAGAPSLHVWRKLRSRELHNYRDVFVALPPSHAAGGGPWPVVWMQDGQNLFDPAMSFAGAWGLVPVLRDLAADGFEVVVVGIANSGRFRRFEYSPFRDAEHGGGDGDHYLTFITDTVMPLVADSFPVRTGPAHTVIAGSSLGGLMSLSALWRRPDVFGGAAALSPAVWFADEAMRRLVEREPLPAGRLYLDVGTGEPELLVGAVRRLRDALTERGMPPDRFRYLEDDGGRHHESHWGRRFGDAIPFALDRQVDPARAGAGSPGDPTDRSAS